MREAPAYIKLLLEYEKRGGRARWPDETKVINAAAYKDPRGAGGMYTKSAGYFEWDEATQSYVMADHASS